MVLLMVITIGYLPLVLPLLLEGVSVNPADRPVAAPADAPAAGRCTGGQRQVSRPPPRAPSRCSTGSPACRLILLSSALVVNFTSVLAVFGTRGILAGLLFLVAGSASGGCSAGRRGRHAARARPGNGAAQHRRGARRRGAELHRPESRGHGRRRRDHWPGGSHGYSPGHRSRHCRAEWCGTDSMIGPRGPSPVLASWFRAPAPSMSGGLVPALPLDLFRRLTNGVYVVGVADGPRRNAFTAAWITQVSFEPLLIALQREPGSRLLPPAGRLEGVHGQHSWCPAGRGCPTLRYPVRARRGQAPPVSHGRRPGRAFPGSQALSHTSSARSRWSTMPGIIALSSPG